MQHQPTALTERAVERGVTAKRVNALRSPSDKNLRKRLVDWRTSWIANGERPPEPTADDITYARILIHDPCSYCGEPYGCIDHADNIEHGWTNLTAVCRSCNSAKGQLTLIRYMLARRLRLDRAAAPRSERENFTARIAAIGDPHGDDRRPYNRR